MTHGPDRVTRALMILALATTYTALNPATASAQEDSIKEPPAVVKAPGEEEAAQAAEPVEELKTGMRYEGSLGFRTRPLASGLFLNAGYRMQLSDSESLLLKNTYIEAGASVAGNPSNAWLGGYVEAVPLAILKLRLQVNYQRHFGTLGFIYQPAEPAAGASPEWDVTDLQNSQDNDLGNATNAVIGQFEVTPRVRLGRFVTILDSRLVYHASQLEGAYHTPFMDTLVESGDLFMVLRPTVGFLPIQVPNETFLMTAVRYERIQNFGATGVTRDSVGALALWGIPKSWWSTGNPQFAALAMYVLDEGPTPTDRVGSLIVSLRLTMRFGAN